LADKPFKAFDPNAKQPEVKQPEKKAEKKKDDDLDDLFGDDNADNEASK